MIAPVLEPRAERDRVRSPALPSVGHRQAPDPFLPVSRACVRQIPAVWQARLERRVGTEHKVHGTRQHDGDSRSIPPRSPRRPDRAAPGIIASAGCGMRISWCAPLNRIGASRTMEDYINYILTIVTGSNGELQAGLQHRVDRPARGAHRRRSERLSRRRAGAHRQRRGGAEPARHLWQRHSAATPMFFDRRPAAHGG